MEHSVKSTEEIDTLSKQASRPRSLLKEEDALDKDAASSSQHSQRIMTSVDKSKLLWKIDMHLVPPLCLVYLLAFLDRVNMGNAVLFGLQEDLGLQGNQYNTALVIFFVPYVLSEIPSNLLLKMLRPNVWLSMSLLIFGIISVLQGFTQNYGGILATRFFLGLMEGGILPGSYYLMSMYYRRAEAQKRYTLMFVSASLAGAFSGLLASAIGKMDGIRGFRGWRWVFILEGLLTCVGAVIAYFSVSDFPENAKWLSEEEREFLKVRLREDVGESGYEEKFTVQRAMKAILDHKVVLGGLMYFGLIVPAYSIVYFAPSIIAHLGHGAIHAQLLSVPPLACGFAIGIIVATLSDYYAHRFLFATVCCMVSIAGFGILLTVHDNPNLQYAAILIASAGTYPAMPIVLCWFGMNVRGHLNRAVATGYQISFGNVGGIIASYAFLAKDAPEFHTGYRICLSFVCLAALACLLYFLSVAWENRKADSKERSDAEGGDSSGSSQFRFIY